VLHVHHGARQLVSRLGERRVPRRGVIVRRTREDVGRHARDQEAARDQPPVDGRVNQAAAERGHAVCDGRYFLAKVEAPHSIDAHRGAQLVFVHVAIVHRDAGVGEDGHAAVGALDAGRRFGDDARDRRKSLRDRGAPAVERERPAH